MKKVKKGFLVLVIIAFCVGISFAKDKKPDENAILLKHYQEQAVEFEKHPAIQQYRYIMMQIQQITKQIVADKAKGDKKGK